MNAEQFLDRLIPPGNFYVVAYKTDKGMRHKAFRDAASMANYIKWRASKGEDTWHACASFAQETQKTGKNGPYLTVERLQENVAQLKAFWIDLDLKRDGDGKDPASVYADAISATKWVLQFINTTGMPKPNLIVNSGYGMHLYWVLETPIDRPTWQPYADALKAAVLATGGLADLVVTGDSARIMRTPETFNYKVPGTPMPVKAMLATPDFYPNAQIFAALQPYVGQTATANTTVVNGLGPAPAHICASSLNANAQANQPAKHRPMSFQRIAQNCAQVKKSLNEGGANDTRPIWYLDNLSLAYHTHDGDQFVHPISSGHKDYDPATVDQMVAQIAGEKATKDTGPPRCASYNAHRPGICTTCPFFNKVLSPWNVGALDGDLPKGYRRYNGEIQKSRMLKDMLTWDTVVPGDVYGPVLSLNGQVHHLSFTYERAKRTVPVTFSSLDIGPETGAVQRLFNGQGMSLDKDSVTPFGTFAMAFMNKLIDQSAAQHAIAPYGWATDGKNNITGIAIAGLYYKTDKTVENVPGGDQGLAAMLKPRGSVVDWKKAADLVTRGRPEAQVMIAAAMGSPLMRFADEPGIVLNFYSRGSGTGKSSTCAVAQNVWGTTQFMTVMDDTANAARGKVAEVKFLPLIWDEMRVDAINVREKTAFMFTVAQGKDKSRMDATRQILSGDRWQVIMICTGNQPLMDHISGVNAGTDANGMRLMDFEIVRDPLPANPHAGTLIANADSAAGMAGKILAEYYAEHAPMIQKQVKRMQEIIIKDMQCKAPERFYIAGMACTMVAAGIAKKLGLVDFDTGAMWKYITKNWHQIRGDKSNDVTKDGKADIAEIFGRFYSDHSNRLVVTNFFRNRGSLRGKDIFTTVAAPTMPGQPVAMHATQREKMLRVDLVTFKNWLAKKNIPIGNMLKDMRELWNATDTRRLSLGEGTLFAGGQKITLEISLVHPDLLAYDPGDDPHDPNNPTNMKMKAAPAQAVAGNQSVV